MYFCRGSLEDLEEINEIFGDRVVVQLTHATAEERAKIDQAIEEKDAGHVSEHRVSDSNPPHQA